METSVRKTFVASTLSKAIAAMRAEFGPDAVFVEQKKVKQGGIMGLGCREMIAVIGEPPRRTKKIEKRRTSAVSNEIISKVIQSAREVRAIRAKKEWISGNEITPDSIYKSFPNQAYNPYTTASTFNVNTEASLLIKEPKLRKTASNNNSMEILKRELIKEIHKEMEEVKKEISKNRGGRPVIIRHENLQNQNNETKSLISLQDSTEPKQALNDLEIALHSDFTSPGACNNTNPFEITLSEERTDCPKILHKIKDSLIEKGVSMNLTDSIIDEVIRRTESNEYDDDKLILSRIKKEIMNKLMTSPPLEPLQDNPLIVMAIGSTGVGKTTTLAKLGALFATEESQRVAFITLDRYRIAASEQLRTYSDILGTPFEEANTAEELSMLLEKYQDMDLIFIDTAGRSVHRPEGISELRRIAEQSASDAEILLLISSNTDVNEMNEIIKGFSIKDKVKLVFTKTDETIRWGPIYTAAAESYLPVAYLTTGQSVPYDIEPATKKAFADALLSDFVKSGE